MYERTLLLFLLLFSPVSLVCGLVLPSWEKALTAPLDDYDQLKIPPDSSPGFTWYKHSGTVKSTGRAYTGYVGLLSKGLPGTFSFQLPIGECCHTNTTSGTAKLHHCTYATNAGYFNTKDGCCVGDLIIDGKTVQLPGTNRVHFALNDSFFIIGYLTNETLLEMKFTQLISGAGWLVRNGKQYVNESIGIENLPSGFVNEKAPRTSIAVHANGTLMLFEVDGVEDEKLGLDLFEFSEVLVDLGSWQAVNLDGGGSSVSVFQGEVVSRPTCTDTPLICERSVTSIACFQNV